MTDYVENFNEQNNHPSTQELLANSEFNSITHQMVAFGFLTAIAEAVDSGYLDSMLAEVVIDNASSITAVVLADALTKQDGAPMQQGEAV